MSVNTTFLTTGLYQYLLQVSLREPPILSELRKETARQFSAYTMQTAPEQAQLLALLIKLMRAHRIIEIGTFTGYSSIAMAMALPPEGRLVTCDVDEKATSLARQYWEKAGLSDKIELRSAPASETLVELARSKEAIPYDFIYIDADKENIDLYYEQSLKLLRPGGLIAVDNVLWGGQVIEASDQSPSTQAIRKFNQKIQEDPRVTISLIPIGDGLMITLKK